MKSNREWEGMSYRERADWLAELSPALIRRQAEVRAGAADRPVHEILTAWVHNGYITATCRAAALAHA